MAGKCSSRDSVILPTIVIDALQVSVYLFIPVSEQDDHEAYMNKIKQFFWRMCMCECRAQLAPQQEYIKRTVASYPTV